jgi:hypothetical protein
VDALKAANFVKIGTATWEGDAAGVAPLAKALRASLRVAANPPDGALDHLWIYLDNADP